MATTMLLGACSGGGASKAGGDAAPVTMGLGPTTEPGRLSGPAAGIGVVPSGQTDQVEEGVEGHWPGEVLGEVDLAPITPYFSAGR